MTAAVIRAASLAAVLLGYACRAAPAEPRVIESRSSGVKITYREVPSSICETFPGVKSYSGYIDLLSTLDPAFAPYNSSLFFWFFESRVAPSLAPLTLWLQGGPGEATVNHAVSGHNGPCIVQSDSKTVKINPYSWNAFSNMLYLDQPVQTGYSYDRIVEGFRDAFTGRVDVGVTGRTENATYKRGKFSSQDPAKTANTSAVAARAVTHFLDLWTNKYSQYKRDKINVWSQSYGGHYAPDVATQLLQQGKIGVNSVGIINGILDFVIQGPYYADFAMNNTYGIKAYDEVNVKYADVQANYAQCIQAGQGCFAGSAQYDPNNYGNNRTVNQACINVADLCQNGVVGPYLYSGKNAYDIADDYPTTSFPPPYAIGYLNEKSVMDALGAKVNFTEKTDVVNHQFFTTADFGASYTEKIGALLDAGVKVSLLHGDRDYVCNWFGGEAVSLAVPHARKSQFAAAGYAPIDLLPFVQGQTTVGQVRQNGKLAFARVYQAGHEGPYYKPAVYLALFQRTILGLDLAGGTIPASNSYSTTGPASVRDVNRVPPSGPPQVDTELIECYVDATPLGDGQVNSRCTSNQFAALMGGTAVIKDRIVVSPAA